ncbi:MAG: glycosyltransferase family 4 protein [Leptospiraceae bacterium]|nr:glycosyltransferase family 4 protein [Leptospiraceae bacterium]
MQKKIGIDCRMIEHSGIGIRIDSLVNALLENNKMFKIYLFGDPKKLIKFSYQAEIIDYQAKIYGIREFFGHVKMLDMDILDIPHFNIPIFFVRKCIVTIHDIIPFKMKEFHGSLLKQVYIKIVFWIILKFSKKVVSVSEFTKKDLIDEFHFSPEKIRVIYNGIDKKIFYPRKIRDIQNFKKKYSLPTKYFLTIGIGKKHKNVEFLIRSLNFVWEKKKRNIPLVVAGIGKEIPEYLKIEASNPNPRVIIFPRVEIEELALLYCGAYFFIYPSLYEGFGFPVLEAQSCCCPVISSNASVLPEVLQNSAYFFDPKSEEDFLKVYLQATKTDSSRMKFIQKGFWNAKRFFWEKSALEVLEEYSLL